MVLKFRRMQSRNWILTAAFILGLALAAGAHPVPFSYLGVQLQGAFVDVALTAHIYDLAHDLQVSPMEKLLESGFEKEREAAIRQMLTPRLHLQADGRLLV